MDVIAEDVATPLDYMYILKRVVCFKIDTQATSVDLPSRYVHVEIRLRVTSRCVRIY